MPADENREQQSGRENQRTHAGPVYGVDTVQQVLVTSHDKDGAEQNCQGRQLGEPEKQR
jgi:hypothetical protein